MSSSEVVEQLEEAVSPVKSVEVKDVDKPESPKKRKRDVDEDEEVPVKKARETGTAGTEELQISEELKEEPTDIAGEVEGQQSETAVEVHEKKQQPDTTADKREHDVVEDEVRVKKACETETAETEELQISEELKEEPSDIAGEVEGQRTGTAVEVNAKKQQPDTTADVEFEIVVEQPAEKNVPDDDKVDSCVEATDEDKPSDDVANAAEPKETDERGSEPELAEA